MCAGKLVKCAACFPGEFEELHQENRQCDVVVRIEMLACLLALKWPQRAGENHVDIFNR